MDINELNCKDSWYQELEQKYGYEFCLEAGYFQEPNKWIGSYSDVSYLPEDTFVIQYSGAFHPFHNGHLETIRKAIDIIKEKTETYEGTVVIHVDHNIYRSSKGIFSEERFMESFKFLDAIFPYKGWRYNIVFEDKMINGCSRNFIRLYQELLDRNNNVYFLCGGDRANFALTFKDKGKCIVAGRSSSDNYKYYKKYIESDRCFFVEGNNPTSSTIIRQNNI